LTEVLLVDFGGDAEKPMADLELGSAEERGVIGGDKGAGDGEDVLVGGVAASLGQFLAFGFLSGREIPSWSFFG
jgi:hypothetical protein